MHFTVKLSTFFFFSKKSQIVGSKYHVTEQFNSRKILLLVDVVGNKLWVFLWLKKTYKYNNNGACLPTNDTELNLFRTETMDEHHITHWTFDLPQFINSIFCQR